MKASQKVLANYAEISDSEYWQITCNLGTIEGGQATNQVPALAACTLDIRYPETATEDGIVTSVRALVPECQVEVLVSASASVTNVSNPYLSKYVAHSKQEFGMIPNFVKNHGGHDGRFFSQYGIPLIISRPLSGEQHTDYEWVSIQSLNDFYRSYLSFIRCV
jgi:succinyl-diaminopimelate desuccinylase